MSTFCLENCVTHIQPALPRQPIPVPAATGMGFHDGLQPILNDLGRGDLGNPYFYLMSP